jgi:hypothetical protein
MHPTEPNRSGIKDRPRTSGKRVASAPTRQRTGRALKALGKTVRVVEPQAEPQTETQKTIQTPRTAKMPAKVFSRPGRGKISLGTKVLISGTWNAARTILVGTVKQTSAIQRISDVENRR